MRSAHANEIGVFSRFLSNGRPHLATIGRECEPFIRHQYQRAGEAESLNVN